MWYLKQLVQSLLIFINILKEEKKPPIPKKWDFADRGFQSRTTHKGPNYSY